MKNKYIHTWVAVIAGGQGTRLFPISNDERPKQFCRLDKNNTFIQATIERFVNLGINPTHIVVITTNSNQTCIAKEQTLCRGILSQNIRQINPRFGYAGAMVKAAEFITTIDSEAVIINTPSDQHIIPDESFYEAMHDAIESANQGFPTILGVKINDLVTATGCGHAMYDTHDESRIHTVVKFIEKPDAKIADKLMRDECSACNTGINIWQAKTLLQVISSKNIGKKGLATDVLMAKLGELKLSVGQFKWHDCGTLKSLYDISGKTPNHHNATLGEGVVERIDCRRSLFYAEQGITLHVTGATDDAVLATFVSEHPTITFVKLAESQRVKELAEDYQRNKDFLTQDFSVGARNNIIMRSNISDELRGGFVSENGWLIHAIKHGDGAIEIFADKQFD